MVGKPLVTASRRTLWLRRGRNNLARIAVQYPPNNTPVTAAEGAVVPAISRSGPPRSSCGCGWRAPPSRKGLVIYLHPRSRWPWLTTAFSAYPVMNSTLRTRRGLARHQRAGVRSCRPAGRRLGPAGRRARRIAALQPGRAVRRLNGSVAEILQYLCHQHADGWFIVHHQDRLAVLGARYVGSSTTAESLT
jgi:hypothetical protein